jgi:hypothetical protein
MHKQRIAVIAAGAIGIIATFLPWASISIFGQTFSVSGTAGDGWISLGIFAAAIGMAVKGDDRAAEMDDKTRKAVAILGGVAAAYMLIELVGLIGFQFSGIGVYLGLIAGIGVAAIPFVIKGDGSMEMPSKESVTEDINEMKEG